MAANDDYNALTTHYKKEYEKKYGFPIRINRQSAGWTWKGMLEDYSNQEIKDIVTFFFEHYQHNTHDFTWFNYNYEKIDEAREDRDKEAKHIADLRSKNDERIKEHEERIERIKNNRLNSKRG